jgi:hypothetical protein
MVLTSPRLARHQPHRVTECPKLARPMVRRGTGLYANQARWQLLEERQDVPTLQLAANTRAHLRHKTLNGRSG